MNSKIPQNIYDRPKYYNPMKEKSKCYNFIKLITNSV